MIASKKQESRHRDYAKKRNLKLNHDDERTGATVVTNYEVGQWLARKGAAKIHPLNHGGGCVFDFGRVKFVTAVHSSSLPDGSYGGNPGGFVVQSPQGNFYYSGDTALTLDMKLIAESTKLAFAVLCLGGNFTMDAEDAVKAADFIGCSEIVGVHYDTFPPIKIDHDKTKKIFEKAGKKLHLLPIGATRKF
jgi:L-ascorbate metabolism protein UlaG (beta-lactamase superfamily)